MATESLFLNAPMHRTVAAGEVIYADGDPGTHMFGIVSGSVALRKGSAVVATLGPEDVFGERALIHHLPRNLTAVATSETLLAEIDQRLFLFLVHESPTFALGVMKALAAGYALRRAVRERVHAAAGGPTPGRPLIPRPGGVGWPSIPQRSATVGPGRRQRIRGGDDPAPATAADTRSDEGPDDHRHQAGHDHRAQDPPPRVHPAHDLVPGPPCERNGLGHPQCGVGPAVAHHQGGERRDDKCR